MNQQTADQMIEIIRKDATGTRQMFSPNGDMCALGGLYAAHTGKSCAELYTQFEKSGEPYAEVQAAYGLTDAQSYDIFHTNDWYYDLEARRDALATLINSWVPTS